MYLTQCLAPTWCSLYVSVTISSSSIVPTEGTIILELNWLSVSWGDLIDPGRLPSLSMLRFACLDGPPIKVAPPFSGLKISSAFSSRWSRNNPKNSMKDEALLRERSRFSSEWDCPHSFRILYWKIKLWNSYQPKFNLILIKDEAQDLSL